jgi:hypothetical protein
MVEITRYEVAKDGATPDTDKSNKIYILLDLKYDESQSDSQY